MIKFTVALLLFFLGPPAASACSTNEVCSDVGTSLRGMVIIDGVAVTWDTDAETSAILGYRLSKWNGSGWTPLSLHYSSQSCAYEPYSALDTGASSGTYRVHVLDSSQQVLCYYDVVV